jgi:hypothetical protein
MILSAGHLSFRVFDGIPMRVQATGAIVLEAMICFRPELHRRSCDLPCSVVNYFTEPGFYFVQSLTGRFSSLANLFIQPVAVD